MRATCVVALISTIAFADAKPHCVFSSEASLPSAAWLGKRYAATWYARAPGEKVSFEQKFTLLEREGERVGNQPRDVTPVDGAPSVMGRLRVGPPNTLGLTWSDDASGQRTASFRTLDFTGKPTTEPLALSREHLPHGDQTALAWNEKTKTWSVVWSGTEPTAQPGVVTHHLYLSVPRGPTLRLDDAASVTTSHSLALEPRGACVVTSWETSQKQVVFAAVCDGKVKRVVVNEAATAKRPSQSTVAVRSDGVGLVAWVDEAPPKPPPSAVGPQPAPGVAPSRPFNAPAPPGLPRTALQFVLLDEHDTVKVRGRLDGGAAAQGPVVAATANGFWVVWSEQLEDLQTEVVYAARISPEGNQQGPLQKLGDGWKGPLWVSVAPHGGADVEVGVLISHGNAAGCAASWFTLK